MKNIYKRHRFPPSVIQHAVWLYYRFNLSVRDVEDLLAERNVSASYEAIRLWINKFGPLFTKRLRRRHPGFGDTYFLDEVFVKIGGEQHYLWRAVDQDGEVVDVYPQKRRDAKTAKRFFRRFLRSGGTPREIFTDTRFLGVCLHYGGFDHSRSGMWLRRLCRKNLGRRLRRVSLTCQYPRHQCMPP